MGKLCEFSALMYIPWCAKKLGELLALQFLDPTKASDRCKETRQIAAHKTL